MCCAGVKGGEDALMRQRRPMGGLEEEIMDHMWSVAAPATTADVHRAVAPELAYTTVMTVLTRLWSKNLLTRERRGRAYVYSPERSEAQYRADQMRSIMDGGGDRWAIMGAFVESLEPADRRRLAKLLDH